MVSIERSRRLPAFDFIQNAPLSPDGDIIDFAASDDDLRISKTSQLGPMVYAVVGDDPYVETPTNARNDCSAKSHFGPRAGRLALA